MGGLSKKAHQFESITASKGRAFLKVDGGGLLFDRLPPAPHELEQKKIAATGIVRAYNLMGYAAVGVASLDLAGGLDFLQALARKAEFAWLSANLVDRATGRTIFRPYLSREVGATRVAVIGLTGNQAQLSGILDERAEIRPWGEMLPPLMAKLGRDHDFIVLLTDLPLATCQDIARQHPRLGLIINSSGESLNLAPHPITPTTIMAASDKQGRNLGGLEIFWNSGGKWSTGENYQLRLQEKQADLEKARGQIEEFRVRPEMVSRVGNLERRVDVLQVEIGDLRQAMGGTPDSFFAHNFYAMSEAVGDDPLVLAVVEETKKAVSSLAGQKASRAAGSQRFWPPGFTGWTTCAACHPEVAARWKLTGHAAAYATLVRKNRQFDFDCLPCHVTGINSTNVDQALVLSAELREVSCEACHGPGRQHAENPAVQPRPVTENTCLHCHVPEHDDNFDFVADVRQIKCRHGVPAGSVSRGH